MIDQDPDREPEALSAPHVSVEEAITRYIEFRDRASAITADAEARVAAIKARMKLIEAWLMERMTADGVDKLKRNAGTAYIAKKEFVGVEDWPLIEDFIKETGSLDMLNRAVNKTFVKEYMAEHNGLLPPGVKYTAMNEVAIRRS